VLFRSVNAKWGDLQADYQRRADLIPNLVATVKGYAQQEKSVLVQVTQARADATAVHLSAADLSDPAKVKAFNDAQSRLSQAIIPLQRLQEAYPDLKSNANFMALQDQLEGTENRIEVARRDYNESVRQYNTLIRTFPSAIGAKVFYGAKPKVPFEAAAAAQTAPNVNFGNAS
ncbi:MAG: LemA family protein, partial [Sphingomonas sp.]|nr:LemA family protein [Sphingomonas sp.]